MMIRRVAVVVACSLALAACGSSSSSSTSSAGKTSPSSSSSLTPATSQAQPGPEGIPLGQGQALAPTSTAAQGNTVDGIHCGGTEQFVTHVHAHLAVYVNGRPTQIPAGLGLVQPALAQGSNNFYGATQCYYWLHTHAADGIIHIESPSATLVFTLGNFFDIWHQPLSAARVASAKGKVSAFVNGQPWTKTPRAIPLVGHEVIQLDVGAPTPAPGTVDWSHSQL
jgi:hypothetical protein